MAAPAGISGNFAEVQAALSALVVKVEAADEVVEETAARIVASNAARLAPRLSGHMAASTDEQGGQVVVDTPYAGYQEFGTRHHKAQPFLRPAKALSEPAVATAADRIYTVATR
jgi:HK97 gp10 family phage protein